MSEGRSLFEDELEQLINRFNEEAGSDTPDFILAEYLRACLDSFNRAVKLRELYYGRGKVEDVPPTVAEGMTELESKWIQGADLPEREEGK
jgi:hypothetical protein